MRWVLIVSSLLPLVASCTNIVLSNDDGWAEKSKYYRSQNQPLDYASGFSRYVSHFNVFSLLEILTPRFPQMFGRSMMIWLQLATP